MAEQIEWDAQEFYKRAAAAAGSTRRRMLLELGDMEADHARTFAAMKAQLPAPRRQPAGTGPDAAERFPQLLVKLLASGVQQDLAQRFTGRESTDEILSKALVFEKDTVVFFLGMKDVLGDAADKQKVDQIIREELGHIFLLTSKLAASE